ncbi:cellulase family glycosylhydrolase [Neptuniibacter sp. QD72_48]|uniref:cellulase family glycosylhydrolase n=1 Tax=unclassified Neptuniibacter TaxID=2630693 RepID=UPI0039F630CB
MLKVLKFLQFLIATCCLQVLVFISQAKAEPFDLKQVIVPVSNSLGLAFPGNDASNYHYVQKAGIGVVRLSVSWKHVQSQSGRFNWDGLDSRIITLQKLGLEPFLTFESNAKWATTKASQVVGNALPKKNAQWTRFIEAVVDRYNHDGKNDAPGLKQPVIYYQVANEWISNKNRSGGWASSTQNLVNYINSAYETVKKTDPNAVFVLGGLAAFNLDVMLLAEGIQILRAQKKVKKEHEFDFVLQRWSENSSTKYTPAEAKAPKVVNLINNHVRTVLKKSHYDMADVHLYGPVNRDGPRINLIAHEAELSVEKIISTECGGPSLDYNDSYKPEDHFYAVLHRNLNVLSQGSKFCLWFGLGEAMVTTWGNRKVPLFDKNRKPKPGYYGYKFLAYLFNGQDIKVQSLGDKLKHGYKISYPNRKNAAPIFVGDYKAQNFLKKQAGLKKFDALCINNVAKGKGIIRRKINTIECTGGVVAISANLPY